MLSQVDVYSCEIGVGAEKTLQCSSRMKWATFPSPQFLGY